MKSGEIVALEIVRDIAARGLSAGAKLPSESEMVVKYGFSRPTVREALRLLEFQGLISIRPGPGAGTVVGAVSTEKLGDTLTLYLHLMGATYRELTEAWRDTEGMLAERAAQNPDRDRVREIMEPYLDQQVCCERDSIRGGAAGFHTEVAELASNRVLALSIRSIAGIAAQYVAKNLPDLSRGALYADHSGIAKAIIDGDPILARKFMRDHIDHIDAHFARLWPEKIGEPLRWPDGRP
ncbi:FadR/GntR family transcriptional regulator [Phenylobacterium sp. VNQ135]|uniref:FadR/GntR family transcriptional regulator n=1 Tax=Phenylobacterium sp. VNQ135 TaxID=3400922 RepID=UPI003C0B20B2